MKNLKNIFKKLMIICTPSVMLSITSIKANSTPIKKSLSVPSNLNLYSGDMLGQAARKRELKAPRKILKTSGSLPNLKNIDDFDKLREDLIYTENVQAMRELRFPTPMPSILMNGDFFINIYSGFTSPTSN